MFNNHSFQIDTTDSSPWSLYHRLQRVFKHANPFNPEQTLVSVQHVFESRNVVDHSQHENSPYRNRPAYLDDPKEQFQQAGGFERPTTKIDPATPKDWDAKPIPPAPKDWSVLGR